MAVEPVLSVRDVVIEFQSANGPVRAVDGVSFDVQANEVLGVVGESGSGKTLLMLAVCGLLPSGARLSAGEIVVQGRNLAHLTPDERRRMRGRDLAMIFQDPLTALNPVIKVGNQIAEMVRLHRPGLTRRETRDVVVKLLEGVHVPNPSARYDAYPHELSGGQRQRAMIAMAMAHRPAILIADEPTTALDVTIQAQVLDTLGEIRRESKTSMILITHDLGVVAQTADRVLVMYAGSVAEVGTVTEIFNEPRHPYTAGLLASVLRLDSPVGSAYAIPGQPPSIDARPSGCVFHPRCSLGRDRDICSSAVPDLVTSDPSAEVSHRAACHFSQEVPAWLEASGLAATVFPSGDEASSVERVATGGEQ